MFPDIQNKHRIREHVVTTKKVVVGGTDTMDFLENQPAWEDGSQRAMNGNLHKVDGAIEWTISRAIRDATQTANSVLQQEAAAWLWICCPDIAEQVELPELHYDTIPALATGYVMGDAGTTSCLIDVNSAKDRTSLGE